MKFLHDVIYKGSLTADGSVYAKGGISVTNPAYSGSLTFSQYGNNLALIQGGPNEKILFGEYGNSITLNTNVLYLTAEITNVGGNLRWASGALFYQNYFLPAGGNRGVVFSSSFTNPGASGTWEGSHVISESNVGTSISAATVTINQFVSSPTVNTTDGVTVLRGFYHNPTLTSTVGFTNIAFESTSGYVKISDLSGTGTRMVTADSTGKLGVQALPQEITISNNAQYRVITGGTGNNLVAQSMLMFYDSIGALYVEGNASFGYGGGIEFLNQAVNGTQWGFYGGSTTDTGFMLYRYAPTQVELAYWNTDRYSVRNDVKIGWSSTLLSFNAMDTALAREAAGLVQINNGSLNTYASLKLLNLTATGLAGSGTRMVTVDANGLLGSQAIPTGGTGSETDPVFTASAAFDITSTNISNWNTAYGWGDHSTAGYLLATTAALTYHPKENQRLSTTNDVEFSSVFATNSLGTSGSVTGRYILANGNTTEAGTLAMRRKASYVIYGADLSQFCSTDDFHWRFAYTTGLSTTREFSFNVSGLTASQPRVLTVPDASGTIALTSDLSGYITGNQTVTLSGAVTGSGTTAITTTLANSVVGISNLSATGTPSSSTYLRGDNTWATITAGGSGTVTSVSVISANGFAGSVATDTTTPAITLSTTVTGLLKGNGTDISAASAGTDYEVPLTFSQGLARTTNTVKWGGSVSEDITLTDGANLYTVSGLGFKRVRWNTGSTTGIYGSINNNYNNGAPLAEFDVRDNITGALANIYAYHNGGNPMVGILVKGTAPSNYQIGVTFNSDGFILHSHPTGGYVERLKVDFNGNFYILTDPVASTTGTQFLVRDTGNGQIYYRTFNPNNYLTTADASSTYQPLDADLTAIAGLPGTSGLLKKTAADTWELDTTVYLTANQTITLSGAVSGSGTTSINTTLANSVVGISNLSATGTPSASTFLRGDNTWATVSGGGGYTVISATTTYNAAQTSGTVIIKGDTTSAGFSVNLPTAVGNQTLFIIKKSAGSAALIIDGFSTETIDGSTSIELIKVNESVTLVSDNTNWLIV